MSTLEERLTKVETNLANLADAQRDVSLALNRVSESIHAIRWVSEYHINATCRNRLHNFQAIAQMQFVFAHN